jgi:flotillin
MRAAQTAEIAARQEVEVREQEAQQVVGQRTAEKDKQVGIATEKASQEVQAEAGRDPRARNAGRARCHHAPS